MNNSKTKIKLESPYSKDWEVGYLVTNKENRKLLFCAMVIIKKEVAPNTLGTN